MSFRGPAYKHGQHPFPPSTTVYIHLDSAAHRAKGIDIDPVFFGRYLGRGALEILADTPFVHSVFNDRNRSAESRFCLQYFQDSGVIATSST